MEQKMIKALEILGNLLDDASNEANSLPNQYTRGMLHGVQKAYKAVMNEIENPGSNQYSDPEEDIPFSTPPRNAFNPDPAQRIKHGGIKHENPFANQSTTNPDEMVQQGTDKQSKPKKGQPKPYKLSVEDENPELDELVKIRSLLEGLTKRLFPTQSQWSEDATEILDKMLNPENQTISDETAKKVQEELLAEAQKRSRSQLLEDIQRSSEEAGLYDEDPNDSTDPDPGDTDTTPKRWNQSFGKGLGGSDFRAPSETVYDPETGEQGTVRTIGAKFNPDEERTVEEWNQAAQGKNNVYYDSGNQFNELEDLQPGE